MGIFGKMMEKIFGKKAEAAPAPPPVAIDITTAGVPAAPPPPPVMAEVDVEAMLEGLVKESGRKSNWRESIVDLMKLVGMESSLAERRELADELGFTGDKSDTATMNIWLHKQVMKKLSENGGKVPAELLD